MIILGLKIILSLDTIMWLKYSILFNFNIIKTWIFPTHIQWIFPSHIQWIFSSHIQCTFHHTFNAHSTTHPMHIHCVNNMQMIYWIIAIFYDFISNKICIQQTLQHKNEDYYKLYKTSILYVFMLNNSIMMIPKVFKDLF